MKTDYVRSQLVARGKTATMTTIGQADVATVKLFVPSLEEQQKIATCLTALDEQIAAQSQKIDALNAHVLSRPSQRRLIHQLINQLKKRETYK